MGWHPSTELSFGIMFVITGLYFLVEIAAGYIFNSLVLQADAYHMLADVVSLGIGFVANKVASRGAVNKKGEIKNTFGWGRSEVVGALINAIFLVALCFTILIEAMMRFADPKPTTKPLIVLSIAVGGLVLNAVGLCLFHEHAHGHGHSSNKAKTSDDTNVPVSGGGGGGGGDGGQEQTEAFDLADNRAANLVEQTEVRVSLDGPPTGVIGESSKMNMRGVYLHILGDFLGSIIVIINCIVIYYVDKYWVNYLDPSMSLVSVGILMYSTFPLAKQAVQILIQTVPKGYDVSDIQNKLLAKFGDIQDIHDFHLWQLVGSKYIATAHMKFKDFDSYMQNSEKIKKYFHAIGIHSLTIQPEIALVDDGEQSNPTEKVCLLACPPETDCSLNQCC